MTTMLRIKNFERFQHYKQRNPPWIKLYNTVLDDYAFACLQDASKWHLIALWLLASRTDNAFPDDARWLTKRIGADAPVDVDDLVSRGFIERYEDASNALAVRSQPAMPSRAEQRQSRDRGEEKKADAAAAPLTERFVAEDHRSAYAAYRLAHRMPDGFDASLRNAHEPMTHGAGHPWDRIGAALVEMRAAQVAFSPNALAGFLRKLGGAVSPHDAKQARLKAAGDRLDADIAAGKRTELF